ncbi:MAG: hypothetical protein H6816_01305 [Phycisphaerales bacterium]|nr:hypothetical protein [Phycisphaerales bacterium]
MSQSRGRGFGALLIANLRASPGKSAVLGVGTIVLIVLLVRLVAGGKPESAEAAVALVPVGNAAPAVATAVTPIQPVRRARQPLPRLRQIPASRDPFSLGWLGTFDSADLRGDAQKSGELTLQLILTAGDADKGLAVISGVVVHPGSTIGRYEVTQIAERYVVLRDQGGPVTLRLP